MPCFCKIRIGCFWKNVPLCINHKTAVLTDKPVLFISALNGIIFTPGKIKDTVCALQADLIDRQGPALE